MLLAILRYNRINKDAVHLDNTLRGSLIQSEVLFSSEVIEWIGLAMYYLA